MQSLGRRNIVLAILGLGIIATVLVFKSDTTPGIFSTENKNLLVDDAVRKDRDTDTDNDGVPDWKEVLSGTDPRNPDTFQTEGGDAAYIVQKENEVARENATSTPFDPQNGNLTEQIARGTFGEYMLVKSGEHPTGYGSPEELAAAIAQKTLATTNPTVYTKNNFTVVTSNKSTLLAYASALHALDQKYPDAQMEGIGQAMVSAMSASQITDDSTRAAMQPYLSLYDDIVRTLIAMPVPDVVLNEHINLTNSTQGVRWSLEEFTKVDSDPSRALIGAQLFMEYSNTVGQMYTVIQNKLATENIPL